MLSFLLGHGIVSRGCGRDCRAGAQIFDHVADALPKMVELFVLQGTQSRISLRRAHRRDQNCIVKRGERIFL